MNDKIFVDCIKQKDEPAITIPSRYNATNPTNSNCEILLPLITICPISSASPPLFFHLWLVVKYIQDWLT